MRNGLGGPACRELANVAFATCCTAALRQSSFLKQNKTYRYHKSVINNKYRLGEMFKDMRIIINTLFFPFPLLVVFVWGSPDSSAFHLKYLTFIP